MCGDIENMWALSWNPNGMDEGAIGYVGIFLTVCKFPEDAITLSVRYKLGCAETGHSKSWKWEFTESHGGYGDQSVLKLEEIMDYDELTLFAELEIIDVEHQTNDLEVCDPMLIAQILSDRDQHQNAHQDVVYGLLQGIIMGV